MASRTISRVLSCVIICLKQSSPTVLSGESPVATYLKLRGQRLAFSLGLASDGVYNAPSVTGEPVVSYTAISPLPIISAVYFLLHFPWSRLRRPLTGILPCEARTFLSNYERLHILLDRPYCNTFPI